MLIAFQDCSPGQLPAGFRSVSGDWTIREVSRPERNQSAIPAVISERHVAFPGICKTLSGALAVVYREGYSHASGNPDDGRIMLVRSEDGGATWGEPERVYDDPEYDDRNAAVSCMPDGTLALIWDKYLRGQHYWAWLSTSRDEGKTWAEPVKMTHQRNVHTRSRGMDLGNGLWLLPWADAAHDERTATYVTLYDPASGELEEVQLTPTGQRNCADEVAVARASSGQLVALIRSPSEPFLWQVTSSDDGRTWSGLKLSEIPSQFTPCDLITLDDGRLLCSFSFRERRNERLVVSSDNGATWEIEDSVDVFDGTLSVGGDRSYPATVQLDSDTIGTVLYETKEPPAGGHIWFVRTPIAALTPPKRPALYQADLSAGPAILLWPEELQGDNVSLRYRFTGRFGDPPNRLGIVMQYTSPEEYVAFEFQMGAAPNSKAWPVNHVQLVRQMGRQREVIAEGSARGDWYNDGNEHTMAARRTGDVWTFELDGTQQLSHEASDWSPRGIIATRAAVAVYAIEGG